MISSRRAERLIKAERGMVVVVVGRAGGVGQCGEQPQPAVTIEAEQIKLGWNNFIPYSGAHLHNTDEGGVLQCAERRRFISSSEAKTS